MNKVYCWLPSPPNVGHASLDISFGGGPGIAEYVSWWPVGRTGSKGNAGAKPLKPGEVFRAGLNAFPDDVGAEGKNPDLTVEITCLDDEDRMRACFAEMLKNLSYNMTVKSCATAVAEVLLAGGACLSFTCLNYAKRLVWTPKETNTFAQLINSEASVILRGRNNGWKPAMQMVWPTGPNRGGF